MTSSPYSPNPFGSKPDDITIKATEVPSERPYSKKIPLTDRGNIPLDAPTPISAETLQNLDPLMRRILNRLPADVVHSFSDRQIKALNKAVGNPAKHHVDIRRNISLFAGQFYLVLLAGPERRSPERLRRSQSSWSTASTAIFTIIILALGLTGYQVFQQRILKGPSPKPAQPAAESPDAFHPTALPWIEREADCQGAERQWKEGLCYDFSHQPEFRRSTELLQQNTTYPVKGKTEGSR